ncbi:MAG: A24 family peptidase [Bacillota bacterium]
MTSPSVLTAVTVIWAATAAFWDLRTQKIPNWLTLPAVLLGLVLNAAIGGPSGLRASALGTVTGVALLFVPFAMGGMGAGDVKMLAAVGSLAGPAFVFRTFLYGSITGGLIALAVIFGRSYLLRGMKLGPAPIDGGIRSRAKQVFPYGVAILAGVVAAYVVR